jgi:hypothetical protein
VPSRESFEKPKRDIGRWLPWIIGGVLLLLLGGTGIYVWLTLRPATPDMPAESIFDICPIQKDKPVVVVDIVSKTLKLPGEPQEPREYFFVDIIDGATGKRIARTGGGREPVHCEGFVGNLVWLSSPRIGSELGLHARSLATGELVATEKQIGAAMPAPLNSLNFDKGGNFAYATGGDGRTYYVSAQNGLEFSETPPPTAGSVFHADPKYGTGTPDGQTIGATDGGRRAFVTLDGAPIGGRDFLQPSFVGSAASMSVAWPNPDSVIVAEETLLDSDVFKLIRLGLDGTVHWEYTPPSESYNTGKRDWVSPNGDTIVYFTKDAHVLGVSAETGTEVFHLRL